MTKTPSVVSIVIRSQDACGKGALIKTLATLLQEHIQGISVTVPESFDDVKPFEFDQVIIEFSEGKEAPGLGMISYRNQFETPVDALTKFKIEISQILSMFLSQVQSDVYQNAKVEYPLAFGSITIEGASNKSPMGGLYRVSLSGANPRAWETSDVDMAMDIFRFYCLDQTMPPIKWLWVKSIDDNAMNVNCISYETLKGKVTFLQNQDSGNQELYAYTVKEEPDNLSVLGSPLITTDFQKAMNHFIRLTEKL